MKYAVVIEKIPGSNYSAYVPDLPGCVATADSLEEIRCLMQKESSFISKVCAKMVCRSPSLKPKSRTLKSPDGEDWPYTGFHFIACKAMPLRCPSISYRTLFVEISVC